MIISFKAFRPDLTCTSGGNTFQYQLGKWNEETEANCVRNGFHSAGNPLDCMSYYPVWEEAVYYAVLCDGDMDEDGCDSKISCTKLKLLRKLDLREFLECSILYMVDYPYMKSNHKVQMERAGQEDINGFVIVRGKEPCASVKKEGSFICLVKEKMESKAIEAYAIFRVDGQQYHTGTWYGFRNIPAKIIQKIN